MQRGNGVKRVNSAICPSRLGWSSASASISQSKAGLQAIVQGWCLICLICLSSMLSQIVDWLVHKPFSVEGQMIAISLVFPFASQTRKAWSKEQMAFIKVTSAPCIGQRQPPQGNNHLTWYSMFGARQASCASSSCSSFNSEEKDAGCQAFLNKTHSPARCPIAPRSCLSKWGGHTVKTNVLKNSLEVTCL